MKYIFSLSLFFLLHIGSLHAQAHTKKLPVQTEIKSILMIGNSFMYYNNGLHRYLRGLAKANNRSLSVRMITINGSALNWHPLEAYLNNQHIGSFSISSNNKYRKKNKVAYDMVIMQDCSQCPINKNTETEFYKSVKMNTNILKKRNIQTALMMTWAYKNKPEMTQQLANAYTKAGKNNKALVLPVGLAFSKALNKHPEIKLYTSDKRHPSLAGTYLAACVIFSSLFKNSPVNNEYIASLKSSDAKKLQQVAWETIKSFNQNTLSDKL